MPPGPDASWEEQSQYFEKYGLEELLAAGHLQRLMEQDQASILPSPDTKPSKTKAQLNKLSGTSKKVRKQLNLSFDEYQLQLFNQLAERKHIPPTTLAKAWLLERLEKELDNLP